MIYPSGMVLIDTSAETRVHRLPEPSRTQVEGLAARYLHATCALVDLEIGHTAQTPSEYSQMTAARRELLIDLPLTEEVTARALAVQELLLAAGKHRAAGAADLLIAACAEVHGALLLHYDQDFEHISSVTGQPNQWLARPGTLP